jgi:branched-chain amino acid transport system permease protein
LLKSVREDELASSSFGKNVPRVRGMVLGVGSGFAGMAGVLYTFYSGFIQADSFLPAITFAVWVMVIVGGSANLKGSLVGALIVSAIDTTTRVFSFQIQASMPSITIAPDYFRYIAYAVMILLVLMYRSKGLLPEKPTKTPAWAVIGKEAE